MHTGDNVNVNELTTAIEAITEKVNSLKTIDITDIETEFINWKSNIENPFKENQDGLFKKHKTTYKQFEEDKELTKPLLDLT